MGILPQSGQAIQRTNLQGAPLHSLLCARSLLSHRSKGEASNGELHESNDCSVGEVEVVHEAAGGEAQGIADEEEHQGLPDGGREEEDARRAFGWASHLLRCPPHNPATGCYYAETVGNCRVI